MLLYRDLVWGVLVADHNETTEAAFQGGLDTEFVLLYRTTQYISRFLSRACRLLADVVHGYVRAAALWFCSLMNSPFNGVLNRVS